MRVSLRERAPEAVSDEIMCFYSYSRDRVRTGVEGLARKEVSKFSKTRSVYNPSRNANFRAPGEAEAVDVSLS